MIDITKLNDNVNSAQTKNISIVDLDSIADDDVMEFVDLISPEKQVEGMHHKKKFLKKYLAEENAALIEFNDHSDDGAVGFDLNKKQTFDGKLFQHSLNQNS